MGQGEAGGFGEFGFFVLDVEAVPENQMGHNAASIEEIGDFVAVGDPIASFVDNRKIVVSASLGIVT